MARPSRTGGKKSGAKARYARPAESRKTTKTKRPIAPTATRDKRRSISGPSQDLKEAREQQAATAEILKVIASSPADVQPVFEAIASSANRLIGGFSTAVMRYDGDAVHLAAFTPTDDAGDEALKAFFPRSLDEDALHFQALRNGRVVQITDTETYPQASRREMARKRGFRSQLLVPLMSHGAAIGHISVTRVQTGSFADHHVQLLQTFADQAVIAIENTRLFNEVQVKTVDLSESLQQQTATADVLKVISRSAFDLETVLDALLSSACRLCGADIGTIRYRDGGEFRLAATYGCKPEWIEHFQRYSTKPDRSSVFGRTIVEGHIVHIPDLLADPDYKRPEAQKLMGFKAALGVPLAREGEAFGAINLFRFNVSSFEDRQIEVVQTFADQAVIAIENVRLFNETQQSLARQAATTEILEVVNSSPGNLTPVFDAILEKATLLSNSAFGALAIHNGDDMHQIVAMRGMPAEFPDFLRGPVRLGPETGLGRLVRGESFVHIIDAADDEAYRLGNPVRRALVDIAGARSYLAVPIAKDGILLGSFTIYRREVRPFEADVIALLQSFATQAAIAIQNARLFNETKEALARQTATADVLKVIASSPSNLQPVFVVIAERSNELMHGHSTTVFRLVGNMIELAAFTPVSETADAVLRAAFPRPRSTFSGLDLAFRGEEQETIDAASDASETSRDIARARGFRGRLVVPLKSDSGIIGAISITRKEPGAFADKDKELLRTFADQAVIAIQNVELFEQVQAKTRELTEALTYQTGSANILNVIASSPTDIEPVLNAIVEGACELCEANDAAVLLKDGEDLRFRAHHGPIDINLEKWPITRGWTAGRAFLDGKPVHLRDTQSEEAKEFPDSRALSVPPYTNFSVRTVLSVPLLRESERVGAILLRRFEMRPFSDKQIALLQTFADQAVIAINNARLFDEVQAKTRDLTEALEQQIATSEVLQVISSSPGELGPVFQSMLANATRLCEAECGVMWLREGDAFRSVAIHGPLPPAYVEQWKSGTPVYPSPHSPLTVLAQTRKPVHVPDMRQDPSYLDRHPLPVAAVEVAGIRTLLLVPMAKEKELVGGIAIYGQEVRPFSDKQVQLVSTFARQAVIAIENARLLGELRQRTADLSKSLDDLRTAQDRLIQTEKLASLGQLTAGIAHEIKNPLNFVNNFSALSAELTDELNDALKPVAMDGKVREEVDELTGMLKDNLEKVVQHGKRADSIVKNMLLHSREGSREHRPADINSLLDESLNLAYHGARAEKGEFNITLQRDFDANAGTVELFPQEVTRAFLNLIANGVYAATRRKTEDKEPGFKPTLWATTKNLGTTVEIRIRDNGTGIPPEVQEKMFNPFFTTKPAGEGTGLGLSMTHDIIVKQHGGRIDVATVPGQFTEFIIVLPRKSIVSNR